MLNVPEDVFDDPENLDTARFLEIFADFKPSFTEQYTFLNQKEENLNKFWKKVFDLTAVYIFNFWSQESSKDDNEFSERNKETDMPRMVSAVTKLATYCCSLKSHQALQNFNQTVKLLYELIPHVIKTHESLKSAVVHLCMVAWKNDLSFKESLSVYAIQYLLEQSLRPTATKISVSNVWNMRYCLVIAIQPSENVKDSALSKEIQALVESCFSNNIYLETEKGFRFLTWAAEKDIGVSEASLEKIKLHLQICPMKHAEALGSLFVKAWCNSNKELRKRLETELLEYLIHTVVHINRETHQQSSIFAKMCKVLNCFHKHRLDNEVAVMLYGVYEAIIWRSLNVANANVRWNAANLLFDCFPLSNPDLNLEQLEVSLNKQYNQMKTLLEDPAPEVRCFAASGVFAVLKSNWDSLPHLVIREWLKILLKRCLRDGNSAKLRCTVIKCFTLLLENPLSHPTVKALAPSLRNSFHDISEKVRLEFCHFLMKFNSVEGFLYWEVVPLEDLLARMEIDSGCIREAIVNLTCKNFFPSEKKSNNLRLKRSLFIFRTNPIAARQFIRHWALMADLSLIVSYMKLWNKALWNFVRKNGIENTAASNGESLADTEGTEDLFNDLILVASILECLLLCWMTIRIPIDLPENKELRKDLISDFEISISKIYQYFKSVDSPPIVWNPLMLLASSLNLKSMSTLSGHCMNNLEALTEDSADQPADFSLLVSSLFNMGRAQDLLDLLLSWITDDFLPEHGQKSFSGSSQKRSRKRVNFEKTSPKPRLAVAIFKHILNMSEMRFLMFQKNREYVMNYILPVFQRTKEIAKSVFENEDSVTIPLETLTEAFGVYCQIILLLYREGEDTDFNTIRSVEGILLWSLDYVVPVLAAGMASPYPLHKETEGTEMENCPISQQSLKTKKAMQRKPKNRKVNADVTLSEDTSPVFLAHAMLKMVLAITSDMVLIRLVDEDFYTTLINFMMSILKQEYGHPFLALACRNLSLFADHLVASEVQPSETRISMLSSLMTSILRCLKESINKQQQLGMLGACKTALTQGFQTLLKHFGKSDHFMSEVKAVILATLLGDATHYIATMKELNQVTQLQELPPLSALIFGNLFGSLQSEDFFREMTYYLGVKRMTEPIQILAFVFTLYHAQKLLGNDSSRKDIVMEAVMAIEPVLHNIALGVKDKFANKEDLHNIPDVIYCKCSNKFLKMIHKS